MFDNDTAGQAAELKGSVSLSQIVATIKRQSENGLTFYPFQYQRLMEANGINFSQLREVVPYAVDALNKQLGSTDGTMTEGWASMAAKIVSLLGDEDLEKLRGVCTPESIINLAKEYSYKAVGYFPRERIMIDDCLATSKELKALHQDLSPEQIDLSNAEIRKAP